MDDLPVELGTAKYYNNESEIQYMPGFTIAIGGKDPGAAKRNKQGLPPLLGMKAEPPEKGGGPDDSQPPATPPKDPMPKPPEMPSDEGQPDFLADLAAVGEKYGADPDTSKALAADFLEALAKCLRGKDDGADMLPPTEAA